MTIAEFRLAIGESLWLFNFCNFCATGDPTPEGFYVCCEGRRLSDCELGMYLGVSERTVRAWRRRLERVGLIKSGIAERRSRRIWVRSPWDLVNSARTAEPESKPEGTAAREESVAAKSWVQ